MYSASSNTVCGTENSCLAISLPYKRTGIRTSYANSSTAAPRNTNVFQKCPGVRNVPRIASGPNPSGS